jgi:hypothetical protein
MISFEKKFVFVHVYKCAGTSVNTVCGRYATGLNPPQRAINRVSRKLSGRLVFQKFKQPLNQHANAQDYKDFLGDAWGDYYSFAFVRNPYDWQISLYEFARQTPSHPQHVLHLNMAFDEYISWRCSEEHKLQKSFVCDQDGDCIVDFVGKFENLASDFARAAEDIGIVATLPHRNKSIRSSVHDYYSDKTQRLVADTFDEDFRMFGYDKGLR